MITKYKVGYSKDEITEVQVLRETEKFVYINLHGREQREAKSSTFVSYFHTWDDAYIHILEFAEKSVISAEARLDYAKKCQDKIKNMASERIKNIRQEAICQNQ